MPVSGSSPRVWAFPPGKGSGTRYVPPTPVREARSEGPERCSARPARTSSVFCALVACGQNFGQEERSSKPGSPSSRYRFTQPVGDWPGYAHFLRQVRDGPV